MRRKCLKCLIRQLTLPPPLHVILCKMKTIVSKPHLNMEKEEPPRKKFIPKYRGWSKKNEIASPFKLLVIEWMIILEDQC